MEATRDAELAAMGAQMNALLGISNGVLTLAQAISGLKGAQAAAGTSVTGAASGNFGQYDADGNGFIDQASPLWYARYRPSSIEGQINKAYNDVLGRNVDAAGLGFYEPLVKADNGFGISQVIADLEKNAGSDKGVPAFARGTPSAPGGLAYVHKDEMINLPRGSEVTPAATTKQMLDNSALLEQMIEMNDRFRRLQAEVNRQGTIFRDWNINGSPGTREGAVVKTEEVT
jgi:hypothetical protein